MRINFFLLCAFAASLSSAGQLNYPVTQQVNQADTFFGTVVKDPYRWLEDDNSNDTKKWVEAQNTVTQNYLSGIPFRNAVKARLEQLWNYPKYAAPFAKNGYYYFYKNDGLQNQSVLYRQKGLSGKPEVFIDPNSFSQDGTAAMSNLSFSKNGKYCTYLLAQAGSDWQVAITIDVKTMQPLAEKVNWIKFSGLAWKGDEGFYYSRYPAPDEASKLSKKMSTTKCIITKPAHLRKMTC